MRVKKVRCNSSSKKSATKPRKIEGQKFTSRPNNCGSGKAKGFGYGLESRDKATDGVVAQWKKSIRPMIAKEVKAGGCVGLFEPGVLYCVDGDWPIPKEK